MSFPTTWFNRRPAPAHPAWPTENGLTFVHHQPRLYNVGDDLCSPRHYFNLTPAQPGLVIMGGGAYGRYGVKYIRHYGYKPGNTVLWGVGESRSKATGSTVTRLPFLAWGLRDKDRVTDAHFLPCVSCLHPMLNTPAARTGTLLFLNADPNVTHRKAAEHHLALANARGWHLRYNNASAAETASALARCQRVITNSYHGAYWALLTGHEVILLGYSSKFISLYRSLGLDPAAITPIQRGDPASLQHQLENPPFKNGARLASPSETRDEFRDINQCFAQGLVDRGILQSAGLA
ncbi:polysaccharide pyruvyl transferase family protein [Saccharospirillum alexandrii]|uniref:polysaccharide pyruvyl transferase family protein n=1 Tax=Saccharospirillum alexandrii TaxID=2448477 RepID=UPI000FD6FF68|nr:polysaccharide pyruvyl transferase family protein [Saccharospirillum alexandrii]